MIEHTINPVLFSLGSISIRYYGLFYVVGLVISYFIMKYLGREKGLNLSDDDWLEYVLWLAFGLLIGGRIFYFVFYDTSTLWNDPLEVFRTWHGGMSFHGSLIGTAVAAFIFARRKKVSLPAIADISAVPAALSLALGRLGNFINGELYGRLWDGGLCIDYSSNTHLPNPPSGCRYPSQILESAKNAAIFAVLFMARGIRWKGKALPDGALFSLFLALYSGLRFFIEFVRQPDSQLGFVLFGWMTMGQVLCIFMFLTGAALLLIVFRKEPEKSKTQKSIGSGRKSI